jgi:outer membrane protein TolC
MSLRDILVATLMVLLLANVAMSQEEVRQIKLSDVISIAEAKSPLILAAERKLSIVHAERSADLSWSNPELAFERATADDEAEQVIALAKEFEMPWVYGARKKSWSSRIDAASYAKENQVRHINGKLKLGYVEISLLDRQLVELENLIQTLNRLSKSADSQWQEGKLSGVERQMIQLALMDVGSRLLELKRSHRLALSEWKINVGIDSQESIKLISDIGFEPFIINSIEHYHDLLKNNAQRLEIESRIVSTERQIKLEKGSILPSITVEGGMRTVDPDHNGYKLGIGIPLPLLNRNRGNIQREKLELETLKYELESYKQEVLAKVEDIVLSLEERSALLINSYNSLGSVDDYLDGVVNAYNEGWMSLPEMLEGIEIYLNGRSTLSEILTTYYADLFELEAISGEDIVAESRMEGDR